MELTHRELSILIWKSFDFKWSLIRIWLIHSQTAPGGLNPCLRTLFFKLCNLLSLPILPLFVFDGPKRVSVVIYIIIHFSIKKKEYYSQNLKEVNKSVERLQDILRILLNSLTHLDLSIMLFVKIITNDWLIIK